VPKREPSEYFDAGYGIVSVGLTSTGVVIVATTGGNYHGISFLASAASITAKVYDASVGTTGNMIDVIFVKATGTGWADKYIPIYVKKGITVSITGTGGAGCVFYGPKG
jgi:hypothetical protein